ncbi:hypothetical protein OROGR_018238 [Orobanche gracilis]
MLFRVRVFFPLIVLFVLLMLILRFCLLWKSSAVCTLAGLNDSICDPYPTNTKAMFSRTVLCMTLGFITLLSMVLVAIYKSNPTKQFVKGSKNTISEIMCFSKADDITLMEAVRKAFQHALLCTEHHPSERPTMHEVSRVLVPLLPSLPAKRTFSTPP